MYEKRGFMDGILLLNKPSGITSRDLVNQACHRFDMQKIGHTGTLDPFAEGLMILTLGKATKISSFIEAKEKTYIGELTLGIETDTFDFTGNIVKREKVPTLTKEELQNIFNGFLGEINQIPPMYSALKVNGEALYKKARRGEVIEREPRKVTIFDFNILSVTEHRIVFEVTCSKGTYIRVLAADIGKKIGCGAVLTMLVRVRVGNFTLKNAKRLEDTSVKDILTMKEALSFFPSIFLNSEDEKKVRNGVRLQLDCSESPILLLSAYDEEPLAIYEKREDGYFYTLRGLF